MGFLERIFGEKANKDTIKEPDPNSMPEKAPEVPKKDIGLPEEDKIDPGLPEKVEKKEE